MAQGWGKCPIGSRDACCTIHLRGEASMVTPSTQFETEPLVLHLGELLQKITDREFFAFCQANRDLRIELTSDGDLIIMPPTGGETGNQNFSLTGTFASWVETDGRGVGF